MKKKIVFLSGKRIYLRPLSDKEFTYEYLSWLNDPEVNRYSQRRRKPTNCSQMTQYIKYYCDHPQEGVILAVIVRKDEMHIGNVALVNIEEVNRCAEISVLIGRKEYWGKEYAAEAIYHITKHAFMNMNLNKVYAGSINPAFIRCVEKLGWKKEGTLKERIWSQGGYHHLVYMSLLRGEFSLIDEYESEREAGKR